LSITANLAVLEGSSTVPETTLLQPISHDLFTYTGDWFASGGFDSQSIHQGYDLELDKLLVAPRESVVIQVVFSIGYTTAQGNVHADFSSGDFDVFSAFAAVKIIS
jgi:hypothetical protein